MGIDSADSSRRSVVDGGPPVSSAAARRAARADVEVALAGDLGAVRALHFTDRRLAAVMAEFDASVDAQVGSHAEAIVFHEVEAATHARLVAVSAQARSRTALIGALDEFARIWDIETDDADSLETDHDVQEAQSAPVVAQPAAVALSTDAEFAREVKAASLRAADIAAAAVRAAAAIVADAAEAARVEQQQLILDAAAHASAHAITVAVQVRARADDLAAAMLARRELRPDAHVGGPVSRESAVAAAILAAETLCAAQLVTDMNAAMADALASSAAALAELTAEHVVRAAEAVQTVAVAAAAAVSVATLEAARLSSKRSADAHRVALA